MRIPIFILTSLVATACSNDPLDPGAGNSLGSGSHTLSVEGTISAGSELVNPGDAMAFSTHFDLRIQRAGQADVTSGVVTVASNGGMVELHYDSQNNGHWIGDQAGYYEVYQVDITADADAVTGVRIDGPDIHTFTAPALGATVDSTMPLAVSWSRHDHADIAECSTHQLDRVTIDDSGSWSLAAGGLRSSKDQATEETITLRRTNLVAPAGAVAGSTLSVTIRNRVDVVVAINPNA